MSKPLRVITLFSGYDAQALALRRLRERQGVEFDLVGWSEIDNNAITAHNILFPRYKARNMGDICKIDWGKLKDIDLVTYSSPCQDFSAAGDMAGGSKGSGTRSALLWEVDKAIKALRPKYLIMENVPNIQKFDTFAKWQRKLEGYGYTNYTAVLNSADYGVPQNRKRLYMVSVLGPDKFSFPKPQKLTRTFADVMEKRVAKEFYFSQDRIELYLDHNEKMKEQGNGFQWRTMKPNEIVRTLCAGSARFSDNYLEYRGKIRSLTPYENLRLMDVDEADARKLCDSDLSKSAIYKMAGNSIVVNVLYLIFKELLTNYTLSGMALKKQTITSAKTSLPANTPKIVGAIEKLGMWEKGTMNANIGCGKETYTSKFLKEKGIANMGFDCYNLDKATNTETAKVAKEHKFDTATCSNVLNVIPDDENMLNVILMCAKAIKKSGTAFFSVYQAAKKGVVANRDSYQRGEPTKYYLPFVKKYFGEAVIKNDIIIATKPKYTAKDISVWDCDGNRTADILNGICSTKSKKNMATTKKKKTTTSTTKKKATAKSGNCYVMTKRKSGALGSIFEPKTAKVDFKPSLVGKYLVMVTRTMENKTAFHKKGDKIVRFCKERTLTDNPAEAKLFDTKKEANDFMESHSIKKDSVSVKVAQIMSIGHHVNIEY